MSKFMKNVAVELFPVVHPIFDEWLRGGATNFKNTSFSRLKNKINHCKIFKYIC